MKSHRFLFFFILCIAAFLRFYNLNWDDGFHLHPDERFLTMVGNAMKLPSESHTSYFNPKTSTMNPMNVGYQFFVYGTFPIIFNKVVSVAAHTDNYNDFTIQGRFLSGFFDLLLVFVVYKMTQLLTQKYKWPADTPLWAAFFYAVSVLPIQLSHFFAVDTFLSFFMVSSFYFALKSYVDSRDKKLIMRSFIVNIVFSCILLGLAIASKVNAIFILPLNFLFFFLPFGNLLYSEKLRTNWMKIVVYPFLLFIFYVVGMYFTVRLANPYYFESANVLNPTPNVLFVSNLKSLKSFEGKDVWFPPAVQWMSKQPVLYSVKNLAFIGLGLPNSFFIVIGLTYIIIQMKKKGWQSEILFIGLWVGGFFLYQSTQFVKALRYFIFIYPFLALFAGIGIAYGADRIRKRFKMSLSAVNSVVIFLLMFWPLAFMSIYVHKNSRVEASEWIFKNLETDALILTEHWDDGLPLPLVNTYGKIYRFEQLPVFDPDTDEKWTKMSDLLQKGDYYILTSNRGWGSIPTVPDKYPRMTKYYEDLFANKTKYRFIKRYSSYPSLRYLGIPLDFPDQWADETFTVYDHPEVNIFKNNK